MGGLPRPEIPPGSRRDLVDALHDLHHRAGWPSLRVMAREAGCSHTTISTVFSSPRLPTWGVLEVLVDALDGDVTEFRRLWLAASAPEVVGAPADLVIAGRRPELAVVQRHLERGIGMLLVTGEAGMGKTRLVSTASALVAGSTFVAAGSCLPLSSEVPLLPVADVLRATYDVDGGQWLKDAVTDCAPYVAGSLNRLVPELDLVLGSPSAPDDEWSRQRLFGAIEAALAALASLRPLAVLLEDLHWADSATLDLVEHLLARQVAVPVLATWRLDDPATPGHTVDWRSRVQRLPNCRAVDLPLLNREETAEQVGLLMGGSVDAALVDRILRRSQGQPLFTEQLAGLDGDEEFPQLLGDLLDHRLSGIGASAWAISRALGVADRPLPDALLAEVAGLTPAELSAGLHELADRRLLRPFTGHHAELRHPLLAETVRRHLLAIEVTDEHRRIAVALSRSPDASPAEVAEHWQRAEDPAQEAGWRVRAAQAASQRFALAQAATQWRRALALWPESGTSVGGVRKHDAYLAAMEALEFTDVAAAWEVASEAMRALTDPASTDAAQVYWRAAGYRGGLGDQAGALSLLEKVMPVLASRPPSKDYVLALGTLEYALSALGREDEAAAAAARAVEVSSELNDATLYRTRLAVLAVYDATAGHLDLALARAEAASRIQLDAPAPREDLYVAVCHTVILLMACAGPDDVAAAARPGLESAASWGLDSWPVSVLRCNVGMALRRAGQTQGAAALVDPLTEEAPTYVRAGDHAARAAVDVMRGRLEEASARFEVLAAMPSDSLNNLIEQVEDIAVCDLWSGRPRAAVDRLVAMLEDTVTNDVSAHTGALFQLAARAAAELADSETLSGAARQELLASLDDLRARAVIDPFARQSAFPARQVHASAWAAETARLAGRPSLELWADSARQFERIGRPHDAAYCRWRGAQVALAAGQGTVATRLLRRAARDAREHVPLSSAIAETADRAAARR